MSTGELKVTRKRVGDLLIASIRFRAGCGKIEEQIEKLFQHCGECVCGRPFALYHNTGPERGQDVETCVPVTQAVETDGIKSRVLEGEVVLSIVHRGPHRMLGEAWEMLFDYIERNNIAVDGPGREIYLEGYEAHPDHSVEYVTELQVPLTVLFSSFPEAPSSRPGE